MKSVAILGAGQAGGWVAKTLRDKGFDGDIALVGDERHLPYERPPLSKEVLLGSREPESTRLWPQSLFTDLQIRLMLNCGAVSINRRDRIVTLRAEKELAYDRLVLTTGSRVRKLDVPGAALSDIYYLRGIDDASAISRSFASGKRLLVVGGGWIGLEIAAAARKRGIDVVLVEASGQLCSRVLPSDLAQFLQGLHQDHGVQFRFNTTVAKFLGTTRVESAELSDGTNLLADIVVIGIGVLPNSEIASAAQIDVANGIVVDSFGRTSDNLIHSAGDVANQPDGAGGRVRLESWSNAQNQAIAVANAMLGSSAPYQEVPYFWSQQYEVTMQVLGFFSGYSEVILRGDPAQQRFARFYISNGKIRAFAAVNRSQDLAITRRLMQRQGPVDLQRLSSGDNLQAILRDTQ